VIVRVDPGSATPPYAQIQQQLATMVRSGVLPTGARLPTIRHLANDLGIAANTVARAYRELELEGLVTSRGRHGTFVTEGHAPDRSSAAADLDVTARAFAAEAAHRGLGVDDAVAAVRAAFAALTPDIDRTRRSS
jgi:DNA-binding transcriptional regulator YhcF (GntR family)